LEEFSLPEQLDEENAWYCDVCDNMRLALKQLSIEVYPRVLMIQLKRFKQLNGKKVKNNEIILYP
jgi:ubiquitin carboxyl-terminal hydrolase 4/11/15